MTRTKPPTSGVTVTTPPTEIMESAGPKAFLCYVDRAENILRKKLPVLIRKTSWTGAAGVLLSVILTMTTSTFHQKFRVGAAYWQALTFFIGVAAFLYMIIALVSNVRNKDVSIESIVDEMNVKPEKK